MVFVIILLIMLAIDAYAFKGVRLLTKKLSKRWVKRAIYIAFWSSTGLMIIAMMTGYFFRSSTRNPAVFTWYYYLFGLFIVIYIPKIIFTLFHIIEDLVFGIIYLAKKVSSSENSGNQDDKTISRLKFITQTGLILAAIPFFSFIWGMVRGRFAFYVESVDLKFPLLPKAMDGLKVVQISDIHIGSFQGFHHEVERAIEMINALKPDIVLFTGDIVNNFYEELEDGWFPILSKIEARYAKYSILGNHDYGNYYHWDSDKEKAENFRKINEAHAKIGFKLLKNTSEVFELNGSQIAIVGVENWGLPPFPQYGNYDLAVKGVENIPFKILLSHDPTHWDEKICKKTDVALTLSGHTHGMQFGVQLGNHKWSPAQYKFPHWAGLYKEEEQYLYVNKGLGYIGYPGRVGMSPEITLFNLHSS